MDRVDVDTSQLLMRRCRYGPRGAAAVVRAKADHMLDVWFR